MRYGGASSELPSVSFPQRCIISHIYREFDPILGSLYCVCVGHDCCGISGRIFKCLTEVWKTGARADEVSFIVYLLSAVDLSSLIYRR